MALRYDLTIPLARVAAMYQQLPKPFKRYQIAPVWRADKPQKGGSVNFISAILILSARPARVPMPGLLLVAHAVLQALGFDNYLIRINNRKILNALAERLGIATEKIPDFLRALDKLDKAGPDAVLQEMQSAQLLSSDAQTIVRERLLGEGDNFEAVAALVAGTETGAAGLHELELITRVLEADGVDARSYQKDISLARGLDYYTGRLLRWWSGKLTIIGSILGGGRYDDLIGLFSRQSIPATGISFGLERLVTVMEDLGMAGQIHSMTQYWLRSSVKISCSTG